MSYPGNHGLLTFSGPAYGSLEEWSTGLRLAPSIPPTVAQLGQAGQAFLEFCATTTALQANAACLLETTKWAPQDAEGRYGGGSSIENLRTGAALGSNTGAVPQVAVVVSLRTAVPRGIGSNGRMYIPATPVVGPSGQMSLTNRDSIQAAAATFVAAINALNIGDVVVASKGRTTGGVITSPGVFQAVTGVRVGRVLDTQRRRRAGLDEDYAAVTPVPS